MNRTNCFLIAAALCLPPALLSGQGLEPTDILKSLSGDWPTYGGDYSGKRYTLLTELDRSTVKNLTEDWKTRLVTGTKDSNPASRLIVSGIGQLEAGAAEKDVR